MKRELSTEEKEIYEKQFKSHQDKLDELKERVEYNKAVMEFNELKRSFDDKWRPLLRNQKLKENEAILKAFGLDIKEEELHIREIKNKLKDGVERPASVS